MPIYSFYCVVNMVEPIPSLVGSRGGGRAEPRRAGGLEPVRRSVVQSGRGMVRWGRPCGRVHGGALEHRGVGEGRRGQGREGLEGGKERANVRYWNDEMTKGKIGPNWQDSQEARQTQDSAGQRREQRRWDGEKI